MKKYANKMMTFLTVILSMFMCNLVYADPTPTPIPGNSYSDTLSTATQITFTNSRQVSVPTNASYPVYVFIALAALSATFLIITIMQRRATHD